MAQPYTAYPAAGYYGYGDPAYGYGSAYHTQYDPYAYWQQQQQQQYPQQHYGAPAAPPAAPAAPQPPQAPPLPADDPPPLPPDDDAAAATGATATGASSDATKAQSAVAASAAGAGPQPTQVDGSNANGGAASASASANYYTSVPNAAQYGPPATQYSSYYDASGAYGAHAAYGAPPAYGAQAAGYGAQPPGYGYPAPYGSYGPPAANSSYAPQVPQPPNAPCPPTSTQPAASDSAAAPAGTPGRVSRWNRAPPPATLLPNGGSAAARPTSIKPATLVAAGMSASGTAGTPTAAGALQGVLDPAKLSAAINAATAAAARSAASGGSSQQAQQQQQFIPVGASAATAAARTDLPPAFNQYVQRALLLVKGSPEGQNKLKAALSDMIKQHRADGTMWTTDWDRKQLPDLGLSAAAAAAAAGGGTSAAAHGTVFDRLTSPYDRDARGRDRRDDSDSDGAGDDSQGYRSSSRYREYGRGYRDRAWEREDRDWDRDRSPGRSSRQRGHKRSWEDSQRGSYSDSGSDSDSHHDRSDSWNRDDYNGYNGYGSGSYAAAAAAAGGRWGASQVVGGKKGKKGKGKKQQRLDLAAAAGRGGGRLAGRDAGRGRGRGKQQHHGGFGGDAATSGKGLQMAAYGWEDDGSVAAGGFIVGTCQKLEKRYLRLTRPPLPEEVRPQPVLESALQRLLGMIESKGEKYLYYNDQFKAMRQDLTVQGIKNDFTVKVYEAHARAALEYGDYAEYNQCQAQLAILYATGLPGSHAEFGAYRLLYQAVYAHHGEDRKLLGTLRQLLGNRVGQVADAPEVLHAMQVRQALARGNVLRFFELYTCAPRLGRRLMDAAVKTLRFKALSALVRTHKPTVLQLPFLARSLGFLGPEEQQPPPQGGVDAAAEQLQQQLGALTVDAAGCLLPGCSEQRCVGECGAAADVAQGLAVCLEWCQQHGAVFDQQQDLASASLLTKDCWNKLFVPVDNTKVAHGDAKLDIWDFLATN